MTYQPGIPSGLFRQTMRDRWGTKVDEVFGEWLLLRPMTRKGRPNEQQTVDPSRPVVTIAGVYRAPRIFQPLTGPDKLNIGLNKPCFSIATDALPYQVSRGDVIVRCANGAMFEVSAIRQDALHIRSEFEVVELGIQPGAGGYGSDA